MIDRPKQKIISPYGNRVLNGKNVFHAGIDLRCYNFTNWKKQPVVMPCACEVIRIGYQAEWGWNVVARPIYDGPVTEIKFIHLEDPRKTIMENQQYMPGDIVGWTTVTEYMKKNGYKEHLHFETWIGKSPADPVEFYDELQIQYE